MTRDEIDLDFVILQLKDPLSIESDSYSSKIVVVVSTEDISCWDLDLILASHYIQVKATRSKLIQESTYFRSLLTGSFSESGLTSIPVHWRAASVVDVLKFIYGCPSNISIYNFIDLMEGALFFGVEALLGQCMTWFSTETCSMKLSTFHIPLASIIEIWNFAVEHAIGSISEQCTEYIARNFMWATSCSCFVETPYNLLRSCLEHPHLTIDSEKHLTKALLRWLEFDTRSREVSSVRKDDYRDILKVIRARLLPLSFAVGKKWSCYSPELADKSISAILSLINSPSVSLVEALRNGNLDNIRVRLTAYTERMDLSGCPQMTSPLLLLSLLPCSNKMDPKSVKKFEESLIDICSFDTANYAVPQNLFPTLLFEAVCEVDISKCPQVHLEAAIKCFCESFPSLKILKASYILHFKMTTFFHLVRNCPLVNEVYLSADVSPVLPTQVSIISTSIDGARNLDVASYKVLKERPLLSNLTKLILEGRTEIEDLDLINISLLSGSLCYLNVKGCTSVTDIGLSKLICKCLNLHSLVASDTYFGIKSVQVLCSEFPSSECFSGIQHNRSTSLASRLQKLHIGGCNCVDVTSLTQLMSEAYMLKSLSLRTTTLDDDTMNCFSGSSLERLDVSETMVSGISLAPLVRRNIGLKLIKSRGCRNLCHLEVNLEARALSYGCSNSEKLYVEIGGSCDLEDVEFGWGFSSASLENLGPAVRSLRSLTFGIGASLSEHALMLLPTICPALVSVVLNFQVISDNIVKCIAQSLKNLKGLGLCYCLGDLSPLSLQISMPNLRILRLERVVPWMTNEHLIILTQNCPSLIEFSLSGCTQLNCDSQQIISSGWPGLFSIHLEDCGGVTSNGVSSLFDCKTLEDLSLRHNGCGIQKDFIVDAAVRMPMLRKIALDLCDASGGGFESPSYANKNYLSCVTIARCKLQKCAFEFQTSKAYTRSVHKETIVLEWNSKRLRTTVVKERV